MGTDPKILDNGDILGILVIAIARYIPSLVMSNMSSFVTKCVPNTNSFTCNQCDIIPADFNIVYAS